MLIEVSLDEVGATSTTFPVSLFVSDTLIEVPMLNLCPVRVKLPEVKAVDERLSKNGLADWSTNVNQQFCPLLQLVGMINLLSTVTTCGVLTL